MPVLPVPMFIALLLAGFLIYRLVARETHPSLLALVAICAFQSAILSLVQYYGVLELKPLQVLGATVVPPAVWIAFAHASGDVGGIQRWALHAAGPVLAVLFLAINPMLLDVLIPLSFGAYGVAMLVRLGGGEVSLPHSRLQSGGMPLLAWRIIALSLIASAACDVAIAFGLSRGSSLALYWLPSVLSSLSLLSLGVLGLSQSMESQRDEPQEGIGPAPVDAGRDRLIVSKLDDYLETHKSFKDPDLTLDRLSRRVLVPAKQLSAAINRTSGENVSRYINRRRIDEACALLVAGQTVTTAMLDSGFNTKYNFNREFLRVKGTSPSKWLQEQKLSLNVPFPMPNSVIEPITVSRPIAVYPDQ